MSLPSPSELPSPGWRWRVVWLLFAATMLNYMDRLALNNTQAFVLDEFVPDKDRQNEVWAAVNFAFGISFALFQVAAGFLVDRHSLRRLYLAAIVLWSAAGVATGFVPAGAVAALMACRVVLGIGEAFNWPCAVACVRRVIPRESRGLANGIFHSGASVGAIATPFVVLLFVGTDGTGWRTVFVLVGLAGALWAVLWLVNTRGVRGDIIDALDDPLAAGPTPPFAAVFSMRPFWICLLTGVCVNLCWHFYNQWFPRYLSQELRVSGHGQQWVLAGFYLAADLGSMTAGWTIRRLIRGGRTVETARKLVMTGLAVIVLAMTVPAALLPAGEVALKYAFFYAVAAAAMGGFSIFFSLSQDIVGRHTAQILGVCGCASWVAISLTTLGIGQYAGPGRYAELFVAVGCVPLIAAVIGWRWPEPSVG